MGSVIGRAAWARLQIILARETSLVNGAALAALPMLISGAACELSFSCTGDASGPSFVGSSGVGCQFPWLDVRCSTRAVRGGR